MGVLTVLIHVIDIIIALIIFMLQNGSWGRCGEIISNAREQ